MSKHTKLPQNLRPPSTTSSRPSSASRASSNDLYLRRIDINPLGVLGALYDARTDRIMGELPLGKTPILKKPSHKPPQCEVMENNTIDKERLFQTIGIDDEMWLDVILKSVPTEGITSLINYSFPKSGNIRFLYYYYLSGEQSISQKNNIVKTNIPKDISNITATHVISVLKLGIQALVVLQLSSASDDTTNLDHLLGKIKEQLGINKFDLTSDDKHLLNEIIVTRVFSNIPDLNRIEKLEDICRKITTMKPHVYRHTPLEYDLRTIKWFYPSYPTEKAKYIPLESDTLKIIKQYWEQLSCEIKELKTSFDPEVEKSLEEHLQQQLIEVQQRMKETQDEYQVEVERLRDLVLRIRSGTLQQESIADRLIDKSEKSFQNTYENFRKRREALIIKTKLINKLEAQGIKYFDIAKLSVQKNDDLTTVMQKLSKKRKSNFIFCSDDQLIVENSEKWNGLRKKITKERETNSSLELVYGDFTYSSFHLTKMRIISFNSSDDNKEPMASPKLQSSCTTETELVPKDQSENIEKSYTPPTSTKSSTSDKTTPVKEKSSHVSEQSNSSAPLTSAKEDELQKDGRSKAAREPRNSLRSPEIPAALSTILPNKIPSFEVEKHNSSKSPTLSISGVQLALEDQSDDVKKIGKSSKSSAIEKTSPIIEQRDYVEELVNLSNLSTTVTPKPSPRTHKQPSDNGKSLKSQRTSDTDDTPLLKEHNNNVHDQSNSSSSSTITVSQPVPRTKTQRKTTEESFHSSTSPQTPIIECTSESNGQPKNAGEQVSSSRLSPILTAETAQQTHVQSKDNDDQVYKSKSSYPLPMQRKSLSAKQRIHEEDPTNTLNPSTNILPSPTDTLNSTILSHSTDPSSTNNHRSEPSRRPAVNYRKILLLGESGVGKSTFINALVNYLAFETFEEANSSAPLVLMPVSFMMTVGDDFKERIVKWGDEDCNEDHDHPGQSVTQYCRSYVFKVGTQSKLRIIDTPGMGDTRGLDQDDLNMQHILSFINNLPHLNAICILLKPNEARLNIVLRSYFTRLLNFLGENVSTNIVFCFTNTRATFFAPGNTGPLLKKMLNDPPINRVPFKKANTFCFDNESFRYLIAVQNGIPFDDYQKEEYERSWTTSVTESKRLLQYICGELNSYSQNEWQSVEHAQAKITEMIRPLSETMRNVLRNIILLEKNLSEKLIQLCPKELSQPSAICYSCKRTPIQLSNFWILSDDNLHILSDKCDRCNCSRQKHITVDYRLKYQPFDLTEKEFSYNSIKSNFDGIQEALLEIADFFAYAFHTTNQNDPMLSALKRMVAEENQMCTHSDTNYFNATLCGYLVSVAKDYEDRYRSSVSYKKPVSLPKVYEAIKKVSEIDMVNEQMDMIKEKHAKYMKQHEKDVS